MRDEITQTLDLHSTPHELALRYVGDKRPLISLLACHLREALQELAETDPDEWPASAWKRIEELEAETGNERTPNMSTDPKLMEVLTDIAGSMKSIAETLAGAAVPVKADAPTETPKPPKSKPKAVETDPAPEPETVEEDATPATAEDVQGAMIDLADLVGRDPVKALLEKYVPKGAKVLIWNVPEDKIDALNSDVQEALVSAQKKAAA